MLMSEIHISLVCVIVRDAVIIDTTVKVLCEHIVLCCFWCDLRAERKGIVIQGYARCGKAFSSRGKVIASNEQLVQRQTPADFPVNITHQIVKKYFTYQ